MELTDIAPHQPLTRSRHLELRASGARGKHLAYHRLFGNLAWVDDELTSFLRRAAAPLRRLELEERVGPEVASVLLDSYFLVPNGDDVERRWLDDRLAERRRKVASGHFLGGLQITSSNACNFACTYCFADISDRRSEQRQAIAAGPANVSFELAERTIRQVLTTAQRHGRERVAVKFLGREPLLNWKVMERLFETFDDGSVVWAVTTNGSLLRGSVATTLARHQVMTMVSLDGPAPVNDRHRPLKAGSGSSYETVIPALDHLAAVGLPFGVSSVVTADTDFETMVSFLDDMVDRGAREMELTLVMQVAEEEMRGRHDDEALARKLVALYEHGRQRKLLMHGDWVDPFHRLLATHKFRFEDEVERPLGASCTATSHQISLEPSGDLFPCRAMSTHYGHVDDLEAALHGEAYEQVAMRTFGNVPYCHGCELEGFCQGTCLGSAEEASGDIYQPQEEYCRIYRRATQLLFETLTPPEEN